MKDLQPEVVLIDDDVRNLQSLREKLLKHCPELHIAAMCESPEEGIRAIDTLKPDIVFLDIEMPVMNGFVMLQQLQYQDFELIFITAYDHYAIKAIRSSAIDYLVKPVVIDELKEAVRKAREKLSAKTNKLRIGLLLDYFQTGQNQRLAIPTANGLQFLNISDIIYLEAHLNYTHIYLKGQKQIVSRPLKDLEELLPHEMFIRIHHSHIVNKNYIDRYVRGEGGQVILQNGTALDVSKRKKAEFLQAIDQNRL